MLNNRASESIFVAALFLCLIALSSNADDFMDPGAHYKKGIVRVGDGIAFELASTPHTANIGPSDKAVFLVQKLDLRLTVKKGTCQVIVPWEAIAEIKKRQGGNREELWIPLLKIVGGDGQEAVLSFYGPCERGDVQAEAASKVVTLSIGQPLDSCDVLRLTYSEKLSGSTCVIYQYLINPCSRTMVLTSIGLSN